MKAISFLKISSTFLTYSFSSKFHLFVWALLRVLGENSVPEDLQHAKRARNNKYFDRFSLKPGHFCSPSCILIGPPGFNECTLVEAVRAISVVLQGAEVQSWLLQRAAPKTCLFLAWASSSGGDPYDQDQPDLCMCRSIFPDSWAKLKRLCAREILCEMKIR